MIQRKILVAEGDREVRYGLDGALRSLGFSVEFLPDAEEALRTLQTRGSEYSLLVLGLVLHQNHALETLRRVRKICSNIPIVVLSTASVPVHVMDEVMNLADDFVAKPVSPEELGDAVQKVLESRAAEKEMHHTARTVLRDEALVSSRSSWIRRIDDLLEQLNSSDVPVLILGETGVGKEMLARRIHSRSPRAKKPFLKLNCAALPSELVESELFGYERGAFTGAFQSQPGKFDLADGGTILLDEIGEMDLKLQAKLLHVLQDGEFLRLGGRRICSVDVRVLAATHCDLEAAIAVGDFREDLYYRLNIIRIEVPPLRDRRDEILPLAEFFLRKHAVHRQQDIEMPETFKQELLNYNWPGNVRELENVIRKLVVIGRPDSVIEDLRLCAMRRQLRVNSFETAPTLVSGDKLPVNRTSGRPNQYRKRTGTNSTVEPEIDSSAATSAHSPSSDRGESILHQVDEAHRTAEVEAILSALSATLWNRKRAAELLHIDYKALLYKMRKLRIAENGILARAAGASSGT